jgi:hypothetical protein
MTIKNFVSLSRKYRVIMTTEDGEEVSVKVTLPDNLVNNAATVEIWYDKYVPEGHLLIDIEIPIESEEPQELIVGVIPTDELDDEEARDVEYLETLEIVGSGNSLDYVGKDEPNKETSEENEDEQDISEEEYLRRKENGGTFASDVEDSPKGGY